MDPGGADLDRLVSHGGEVTGSHLGATGIVDADEQDGRFSGRRDS
jgi:hypothetical protein